jgi:hypothetical protein
MELVKAMALALGDGDMEKGQEEFVKRNMYMTEAAFYTGLSYDWEIKVVTREINGKTVTSKPPLPVRLLGTTAATAKKNGKSTKSSGSGVTNDALDKIIIDNAAGKTDRELKSFAVRQDAIKDNDAYMKAIVSGKRLQELENEGKLTKDPSTDQYL